MLLMHLKVEHLLCHIYRNSGLQGIIVSFLSRLPLSNTLLNMRDYCRSASHVCDNVATSYFNL